MMPLIIYMLKKYNDVINELRELNIPIKTKILYFIISLGVSLLIFSGILCILINLLIFRDFQKLIAFAIATVIVFIFFITDVIYFKALSQKRVSGIRIVILTDSLIFSIGVYIILIILYILGVV